MVEPVPHFVESLLIPLVQSTQLGSKLHLLRFRDLVNSEAVNTRYYRSSL